MGEERWNKIPEDKEINETVKAIESKGIKVVVVNNKEEALEKLKEIIPKGAEISNGSSTTLQEIGFIDYLKEKKHGWKNLHEEIINEKDKERQAELRRKSVTAEYFIANVIKTNRGGELTYSDRVILERV